MSPSLRLKFKNNTPLWLGAIALMMPWIATASTVTVDFTFTLGGSNGTGEVMFDPTLATSDAFGPFVNDAHGLTEFDLTYGGHTYTMSDAIDFPTMPEVFLPGNTYHNTIGPGQIGLFGYWVVPGTDSGGFEDLIGIGRTGHVFLLTGVSDAPSEITFGGSGSSLTIQVCKPGDCPNFQATEGAVAPEPALIPLMSIGLAGLWFVRRRRVTR